jgi:N-acetylglucosamine repressor
MMRELNRSLVLEVLRRSSPTSRASIAKMTSLAKPTVSAIVDELVAEGLVREIGAGATAPNGGRPPILLEYNERSVCVAGVQIGVNWTTVVVADGRGAEIGRRRLPTPKLPPEGALEAIAAEVTGAVVESNMKLARLAAVGVVLPGLTDFLSGICLLAPNLRWRNVPVRDLLSGSLTVKVPVFVHNAAQAVAVSESLEGAGAGEGDLAVLYTGTGVGAGILRDGRVFHGHSGIAGEIGHCRVEGARERCNCGKVGCLETVASGPAIERAARAALAAGRSSSLAGRARSRITTREIAAAAQEGDPLATEVIAEAGVQLGLAGACLINLFDPGLLVVGGGLVEIGEPLLEPLRQTVRANVLSPGHDDVEVRVSELGQDAEVRGAVLLALQQSEVYYRVVFQG